MTPLQRDDDRLIGQLIQKMDDYMHQTNDWRKSHDASAEKFREDISGRLKILEDWVNGARFSWKFLIALLAAIGGCIQVARWVYLHFKGW